jgi:hypothetical protein
LKPGLDPRSPAEDQSSLRKKREVFFAAGFSDLEKKIHFVTVKVFFELLKF